MNAEKTFSQWDDVVFENRNKSYGAYFIRHAYERNLSKASFYGSLLLAALFISYYVSSILNHQPIIPKIIKQPVVDFFEKPNIIPDPPAQKPIYKPQHVVTSNTPPRVVITEPIEAPPVETQTTTSSTGVDNGSDVLTTDNIGVEITATSVAVDPPKIFDHAEIMPEFEGGLKGLYKFLRKNLHYPVASRSIGEEGTVYVRFIVDATGAIGGVEVVRGVSGSLDREAARVVALMPKWKPGRQHDSPVNVRMMLPITFALSE